MAIVSVFGRPQFAMATRFPAGDGDAEKLLEVIDLNGEYRGRVRPGGVVARSVVLRNLSPWSLTLATKRVSCGCITPAFSCNEMAPGGEAVFTLATVAAEAEGRQAFTAAISATANGAGDRPVTEEAEIAISYDPDVEVTCFPHLLAMRAKLGEAPVYEIWVRRVDGTCPKILGVDLPGR